jgi:hypothetical protein
MLANLVKHRLRRLQRVFSDGTESRPMSTTRQSAAASRHAGPVLVSSMPVADAHPSHEHTSTFRAQVVGLSSKDGHVEMERGGT